jgi:hypothetical protein
MEWLVALFLAAFLGYLIYEEVQGPLLAARPSAVKRKRLCDYTTGGSVWEDPETALRRGTRLLEVHIYSDEQDHPVVAVRPQKEGQEFADPAVSFESVCVAIANDAFPSKDPFILSIVPETEKTIVMDRVAEHIVTTVRKHLVTTPSIQTAPIDDLANGLILVSRRTGSQLDTLLNLTWDGSDLRRLTYAQAVHPSDERELMKFNREHISLVVPDASMKVVLANPERPKALGCQWNLFDSSVGFVEKQTPSRSKFVGE